MKATTHCHFSSGRIHRSPPIAFSAVALGPRAKWRWPVAYSRLSGQPLLKWRWVMAYAIVMVVAVSA